jgi:hypothetical protein
VAARANITLKPSASASPEQARDARARAWAYILACFEPHANKKEAAPVSRPDDGTKVKEDSANEHRSI